MITCHRIFLEQRCNERGYTIDEVMPCVISQNGDEWTIDTDHAAYPRISKIVYVEPTTITFGPGTELKNLLSKIGIVLVIPTLAKSPHHHSCGLAKFPE